MARLNSLPIMLAAVLLATACQSPSQPIRVSDPGYILVVRGGQLQLDVISQHSFSLAGSVPIETVGATPPSGAVAISGPGSVIVTHTGAATGVDVTVKPATIWCTIAAAKCQPLIDGSGSATIFPLGDRLGVPVWSSSNVLQGQLAWIAGSPPQVTGRLSLLKRFPGAMRVTTDGRWLYWLTMASSGATDSRELLRYDLRSQQLAGEVSFGDRVPFDLAIGPDGDLYVSILYAQSGSKLANAQPSPAKAIERYTFDLKPAGAFTVAPTPTFLTIDPAGKWLAVAYQTGDQKIDLFGLPSGTLLRTIPAPGGHMVQSLATLANGDLSVVAGTEGGEFRVGVLAPGMLTATWHTFPGQAVSALSG